MTARKTAPAEDTEPLVIAPDEIVYYFRERWLGDIESGRSTIAETVLPYLEEEAIKRFGNEWTVPKVWRPDKRKDYEGWRLWWLNEARQNCDSFDPVAKAGAHLTPAGESAVNLLVIASELRDALDRDRSELSCALGMLLIAEVISGGYSMEVNATKAAHDAIQAAKFAAYKNGIGKQAGDYRKARAACSAKAKTMWASDSSLRIGAVAKSLREMLTANLEKLPTLTLADIPGADTIKTWLKEAAEAGDLTIPAAAQRRGRPSKAAK